MEPADAIRDNEDLVAGLPGGRVIGYAEYGDPSGTPVMLCHGFPGSRLQGRHLSDTALAHGIRLVAVDRPGIGVTSACDRGNVAGWAADAWELACRLGLGRLGVLGLSGGGPYALALAAARPADVGRVAVVSSPCPLDDEALRLLGPAARFGVVLGRAWPSAFRFLARRMAVRLRRQSARGPVRPLRGLDPVDVAAEASAAIASSLRMNAAESVRAGTWGLEHEALMYVREWGFDPADVACEVDVWHGDLDRLFPPRLAEKLAAALHAPRLTIVPGQGHVSLIHACKDAIVSRFDAPEGLRAPEGEA